MGHSLVLLLCLVLGVGADSENVESCPRAEGEAREEQQADGVSALQLRGRIGQQSHLPGAAPPQTFEYIVVGAGSSGSTLAARLAKGGKQVLLIERGPDDNWTGRDWMGVVDPQIPGHWMRMLDQREVNPGHGPTGQATDRAEMVGGCSMHNAMIWLRGSRGAWDAWGSRAWSYERCVLPKFIEMETNEMGNVNSEYAGRNGSVRVSSPVDYSNTNDFFTWASSQGLPFNQDMNGESDYGFGPFPTSTSGNKRWSLSKAFLTPEVRALPNFKLLTHSMVRRILFKGTVAVGVEYDQVISGMVFRKRAWASKEVIISAGAYRTPQILMLSGVGPRPTLERLKIPEVVALPGVGKNLHDHPYVYLTFGNIVKTAIKQLLQNRTLPFADSRSTLFGHGAMFYSKWCKRNRLTCTAPDMQLIAMDDGAVVGILGTPQSKGGEVNVTSTDPRDVPSVTYDWTSHTADTERYEEFLDLATTMPGLTPARYSNASFYVAVDGVQWALSFVAHPEKLVNFLNGKRIPLFSLWHPAGTSKMGAAWDPMAVVDYRLRVHGVHNLRVADASIMPEIINSNINAPCAMIGFNLADMILGKECV